MTPDLGELLRALAEHPLAGAVGQPFGEGAGLEEIVPIIHAHAGADPAGHVAPAIELRNRLQTLLVLARRSTDDIEVAMGVEEARRGGTAAFGLAATGVLMVDGSDLGLEPLGIGDAATDLLAWFALALLRLTAPRQPVAAPAPPPADGEPPRPPSPLHQGQWIVGRYLGRGMFGVAYAGHRSWTDTGERALKIYYRPANQADGERLRRELARISELPGHPNLQSVHYSFRLDTDDDEWDGRWATVSELGTGMNLSEAARSGRLHLDEARAASIDVARGLKALHSTGVEVVPHGDLHGGNVFEIDGVWKLADFGVTPTGGDDAAVVSAEEDIRRAGALIESVVDRAQVPDGDAAAKLVASLTAIAARCAGEPSDRPSAADLLELLRHTRPSREPGLDDLRRLAPQLEYAAEHGHQYHRAWQLDRDIDAVAAVADRDRWLMECAAAAASSDHDFLALIDRFVDRMARVADSLWPGPGPECRAYVRRLAADRGLGDEPSGPAATAAPSPAPIPDPRSVLQTIVMGEWVVPAPGSDWEALQRFLAASDERGHHAPSIVVDGSGQPLTPPGYVDHMAAPAPDGRTLAYKRRMSADWLGQSPGSDWARDHAMHLMFVGGSPFESTGSLYHHLYVASQEPGPVTMRPLSAGGSPAWSNRGDRIAVLDTMPRLADETRAAHVLWIFDADLADGRVLATFSRADSFGELRLEWSGDDAWLLGSDIAYGRNVLVSAVDGSVAELPLMTPALAWHPAAGPNVLLGILPPRGDAPPTVVQFDLATLATEELGTLSSPAARAVPFVDLAVAPNGEAALSTAAAGGSLAEAGQQTGPLVTVLVDLERVGFDPVLPPMFASGSHRTHVSPRWLTPRRPATAATEVAARLLETATRSHVPRDDDAHQRIAADWLTDAGVILAAWEREALPPSDYQLEFGRLVAAALEVAPDDGKAWVEEHAARIASRPPITATAEWLDGLLSR